MSDILNLKPTFRRQTAWHIAGLLLLVATVSAAWCYYRPALRSRRSHSDRYAPMRTEWVEALAAQGEVAIPSLIKALQHNDAHVRRDALLSLLRFGPAVTPYADSLRECLSDPNPLVRSQAVMVLGRVDRDSPATIAALAAGLADQNPHVRSAVSSALMEIGPRVAPVVLPVLSNLEPDARLQAIRILQHVRGGSDEVAAALRRRTTDTAPGVRELAVSTLLATRKASLPEVLNWLHDDQISVASAAVSSLPQFGSEAAVAIPDLIVRLECPLASELPPLLFALRSMGHSAAEAAPALCELLESPVDYDHADILETLIEISPDSRMYLPLLVAHLREDTLRVAGRAGGLLTRVDPEVARQEAVQLALRLNSRDDAAVSFALAGLRGIGPPAAETTPQLVSLLLSRNEQIQEQVAATLVRIGPGAAAAVPTIVTLFERGSFPSRLTVTLIEATGAIGPAATPVVPLLMERLTEPRGDLSGRHSYRQAYHERCVCSALLAIARIGSWPPEYPKLVEDALSEQSVHLRTAAMRSLAARHDATSRNLPAFLKALDDFDPYVRLVAAQTIVDIGSGPQVVTGLTELLQDNDLEIRAAAAVALGRLGTDASPALPALRTALASAENFLPIREMERQRNRSRPLPGMALENEMSHLSVAKAIEQSVIRIAQSDPSLHEAP